MLSWALRGAQPRFLALFHMFKTSLKRLQLQVAESLKMQIRGSVFEVIFPLGGKMQVIQRNSGVQAIMVMFC